MKREILMCDRCMSDLTGNKARLAFEDETGRVLQEDRFDLCPACRLAVREFISAGAVAL
jgi:hypothetical protein